MTTKFSATAAFVGLLLLSVLLPAQAKPDANREMAPVDRYLMPRADEIAFARSAAPPSVADHATVMVLTREGYVVAANGSNGFVCLVERSWDRPFNTPRFWNPKIRGANCLNPPAARSVLPFYLLRAKLALAQRSEAAIRAGLQAALAAHRLPQLEPDSFAFMLSKRSYLTDSGGNLAHVMFFVPTVASGEFGDGL
ncbi:MAG: hypothetical protein ACRD2D_01515, partial [Terriglobales bacterium]